MKSLNFREKPYKGKLQKILKENFLKENFKNFLKENFKTSDLK